MTIAVWVIFGLVYLGMILGGVPFLKMNRTGVALLGAIAMIAIKALTVEQAARAVHLPTVLLLFAFMVVAAQMHLGGFYDWVIQKSGQLPLSPPLLVAVLIVIAGGLSALFSNDVVCLAVAPVLVKVCQRKRLDPIPFALALACAANIGSAATLIGNPQNMLIGQTLQLPFGGFVKEAIVPVVCGLIVTWGLVVLLVRGRWWSTVDAAAVTGLNAYQDAGEIALNPWQTAKGLIVASLILLAFLFGPWPREVVALTGAGVLLMSRQLHSSRVLGLVDWELLVMFIGLFVVNAAFQSTGLPAQLVADSARWGLQLDHPATMFGTVFVLSNVVSNVPAVMLLLPMAQGQMVGVLLALVSTFAGNLFIVGSIANIIVVDAARRHGVQIDWRRHAALGVPVTVITLALVALYLWIRMHHAMH
ncbi:MAG: anion transporter [Burkholderiales bacterium]|nr:anion transporter [Burkholderiales bacterium]